MSIQVTCSKCGKSFPGIQQINYYCKEVNCPMQKQKDINLIELEDKIRQWGVDRNITIEGGSTVQAQASKGLEEMAELVNTLGGLNKAYRQAVKLTGGQELEKNRRIIRHLESRLKDDIGDVVVCMIQAARLADTNLTECLTQSWGDIKDRKGTMIDGKFHKE